MSGKKRDDDDDDSDLYYGERGDRWRTFPAETFKSRVAACNGRLWSSWACERCRSRADAQSERLAALYTYWRRLWDVSTPMYRAYLSSCVSWP